MSFASYRKRGSLSSERPLREGALREYLARHSKPQPQEGKQLNGQVTTQQSAAAFLNSLTPEAFEKLCPHRWPG
jgi:hypothetical protein